MKTTHLLTLAACALLPSCAAIGSAVTGQPIATVTVQRADGTGKPFEVAASDVVRAETTPGQAWGLYNAGAVAGAIEQAGK